MLSHLRSCERYDEPETLPSSICLICPTSADGGQLPHELGTAYVMVNVPDYTLKVVNLGRTVWWTRIVVGKPGEYATPLLAETMKYITLNPTWSVPPSIIRNEYLPALERDPNALSRLGLKIEHDRDGSIHIFQPPGERNALGRIRFNFPKRFLVYQHDTPNKNLFEKPPAFSHGCMRVQNPDQYAEVLLRLSQPEDGYTAQLIRSLYGTGERNINLKTHPCVHRLSNGICGRRYAIADAP
jgi:L,D-transpeptidase YcbB